MKVAALLAATFLVAISPGQRVRSKIDPRETGALIAEIREAFRGVGRAGGVSWSESAIIDTGGTPAQRAAARAKDKEKGWESLVDDPKWNHDEGIGGWTPLDPIGFRYYLPAGMIRAIRTGYSDTLAFHLILPIFDDKPKARRLEQWSRLTPKQKLCVRHFVQYMVKLDAAKGVPYSDWQDAFKRYWINVG